MIEENVDINNLLSENGIAAKDINKLAQSMSKESSKMHKIRDFKARIMSLLDLYASKTLSHKPLFKSLNGVFPLVSTPDALKLDRILNLSLRRGAGHVSVQEVDQVLEQFRVLMLKTKSSKQSKKFTETYINLVLKRMTSDKESTEAKVKTECLDLLGLYISKRTVKIHPDSFKMLIRKFKFLREPMQAKIKQQLEREDLREAMKKQLKQMLKWFGERVKDEADNTIKVEE